MALIFTDLKSELLSELFSINKDDIIIDNDEEKNGKIYNCIGCFGCWVKTPGECVIRDNYNQIGQKLSSCNKLIIVSECVYGGFSPFVKNVLDRAISYIHPYFKIRNGEMHHKRRYDNKIEISAFLYGGEITQKEKNTMIKLVAANAINYDGAVGKVEFFSDIKQLKGVSL